MSATASGVASLSPQQQAIIARIDSLWEAEVGLASREEISQSIARARASADSLYLLNLLCREGRLLAALNRALEAEPVLREGMLLATALKESHLYRACLRWLGVALIGQGRLREVLTCFDQLLRLSQESGDRYYEGYAWMGLAYHDWQSGKPGEARTKYGRSVGIFRDLRQVRGELWALVGLNNALTMLGSYEEAIAGHRRIVAIGKEGGMREIEALGHNNLGVLLFSLGDTGEALSHFQRAADLQAQMGNIRESIIAGQNVCICETILGRTREASRRLRDLLETSRENGYIDAQVKVLNSLAYAHLQQGDCRLAAQLFRQALGLSDGLTPKDECEILTGLSQAMARMDSTRSALQLLRSHSGRMLRMEDARMELTFRNEMAERLLDEGLSGEALDMATAVESRGAPLGLTAHRLEALPLAAQALLRLGRQDSALALLRRGVRLWESHRGLPLDPEWREQRSAAARRLFTQLTWVCLHYPSERPSQERIREAFDALQTYKARTLLERMMGPGGPEVPVLQASPVTLDELQTRVLLPGELLLDFIVGPRYSLLFACTPGSSRAVVLPGEKELNRRARLFHELLAARPRGSASAADIASIASTAENLADLLFSSCADLIAGSRHVIVVPDGALNLLPISYLLNVEETSLTGAKPVGASSQSAAPARTVSQVPAATMLAWLRRTAGWTAGAETISGRILALPSQYTGQGKSLPGTKKEVGMLARRYAGVTTRLRHAGLIEESAPAPRDSESAARSSLEDTLPEARTAQARISEEAFAGFDVLHFAAHSTVDDQSPWRSSIDLGIDGDGADRHALRASEIAGWKLPARLVVLSSCESARGKILSGEGVQGLTSAFLSARVPSVLATLWPVDDDVTVDFIAAFYDALHQGESISSSVLRAQDSIRRQPRTSHPFYWAGFVVVGDGETHVNLLSHPRTALLWWTLALAPVIIWLALRMDARRHSSRA